MHMWHDFRLLYETTRNIYMAERKAGETHEKRQQWLERWRMADKCHREQLHLDQKQQKSQTAEKSRARLDRQKVYNKRATSEQQRAAKLDCYKASCENRKSSVSEEQIARVVDLVTISTKLSLEGSSSYVSHSAINIVYTYVLMPRWCLCKSFLTLYSAILGH